jgi:hypothetical protein
MTRSASTAPESGISVNALFVIGSIRWLGRESSSRPGALVKKGPHCDDSAANDYYGTTPLILSGC